MRCPILNDINFILDSIYFILFICIYFFQIFMYFLRNKATIFIFDFYKKLDSTNLTARCASISFKCECASL